MTNNTLIVIHRQGILNPINEEDFEYGFYKEIYFKSVERAEKYIRIIKSHINNDLNSLCGIYENVFLKG